MEITHINCGVSYCLHLNLLYDQLLLGESSLQEYLITLSFKQDTLRLKQRVISALSRLDKHQGRSNYKLVFWNPLTHCDYESILSQSYQIKIAVENNLGSNLWCKGCQKLLLLNLILFN